jgi:hypothetical protein
MTAPRGVPYIATRAEAAIGSAVMLRCWPSGAARSMPRSAPRSAIRASAARASCSTSPSSAWRGGDAGRLHPRPHLRHRQLLKSLEPWFAEIVAWHGLSGRCAAIRMLDSAFTSINDVAEEKEQLLVDLANKTVTDHGADVVILAGAPLAGLATSSVTVCPVPLVDGIQAAVTMAEGLVRLNPRKPTAGTFRRPGPKGLERASPRRWPT